LVWAFKSGVPGNGIEKQKYFFSSMGVYELFWWNTRTSGIPTSKGIQTKNKIVDKIS